MSDVFKKMLEQLCVNCVHKDNSLEECKEMLEYFKKTRECFRYKCNVSCDTLNLDVQTDEFIAKFLNMKNNSKI